MITRDDYVEILQEVIDKSEYDLILKNMSDEHIEYAIDLIGIDYEMLPTRQLAREIVNIRIKQIKGEEI